jgi:transcriptional regulator with XRE-family HTH domain
MSTELDRKLAAVLHAIRTEKGLTQTDVAELLRKPQSFVAKYESSDRGISATELIEISQALGVTTNRVFNRLIGFDSILDRLDLSEEALTKLVDANPSLRGMVVGYVAESKFQEMYLSHVKVTSSQKDDDHDRGKKGDRRIVYDDTEIVVEVKSLQTNTVKKLGEDEWAASAQVDASDRRYITLSDGSKLETTLLLRGEFDVLAVNCYAFGSKWRFVFALNSELATSTYRKYPEEAREQLIASLQKVTWPPEPPFSDDFEAVLDRAAKAKLPGPALKIADDK